MLLIGRHFWYLNHFNLNGKRNDEKPQLSVREREPLLRISYACVIFPDRKYRKFIGCLRDGSFVHLFHKQ